MERLRNRSGYCVMKKALFLFSMLAFTLVSCEREADLAESESLPGKVTVKATMADAMRAVSASRTAILDESARSVCWTPRDEMSLFYGTGTGGGNKFVSKNTQNQSVADFEGTIGVVTAGADFPVDKTFFWGLYPYDPEAVCDGTSIVTTLSPNQTAVAGSFETGRVISIARSQNLGLSFYNVCSGLRVKVVKEGVVRMKLKSLDGSPLAGKARITMDDSGIPYVQEVLEGSDEITLSAPAGKYLEPGQNYYFMFFPHDFNTSFFTITFETMTETATYERKRAFKFNRSDINEFSVPIDQSLTYSAKAGNIPIEDPAFKTWLTSNGFDTDSDGEISYAEAENVTDIDICSNEVNLKSLKGIEYMPSLERINCPGEWYDVGDKELGIDRDYYYIGHYTGWETAWGPIGTLEYLDVRWNKSLKVLNIQNNSAVGELMSSIDLTNNPSLEELRLGMTYLNYPDISQFEDLRYLDLGHLRGTVPTFSNNHELLEVIIDHPQDEDGHNDQAIDYDFSQCPKLERLILSATVNSISDLSNNPKLKELKIGWSSANLQSIDVSDCPDLEIIETIGSVGVSSIDVSANASLRSLNVDGNNLTALDLSNNTELQYLNCRGNNLTQLDLSSNTELITLDIAENDINSIDLSGLVKLETLYGDLNTYSVLDISNNVNLVYLDCSNTNIQSIDLSTNTLLKVLLCTNTGLTSLDLSNNTALEMVDCRWNTITTLDASKNPHLGENEWLGHMSSLYCVQNNDSEGTNYLRTLYIAEGQVIPFVTENRSEEHIPATTSIQISPGLGGGEGYGGGTQEP